MQQTAKMSPTILVHSRGVVAPLSAAPNAVLVDLSNNDKRMLAAIVPRDGIWWFYKMTGGAPAVANAREAFIGFVSSKP